MSVRRGSSDQHLPAVTALGVSKLIDDQELLPMTDLEARSGECVAVLGQNGSGKTTLLRILAGRLRPSSGEVRCFGGIVDERSSRIRRHISALVGVPALYPDLTLGEQLRLINASWGIQPSQSAEREAQVLKQFGIDALHKRFAHELSSGQTQMFSLATAFIRPFTVLILDEPEQRLDPERKDQLVEAIRQAKQRGSTVIFTCHDAALVERVADRRVSLGGVASGES